MPTPCRSSSCRRSASSSRARPRWSSPAPLGGGEIAFLPGHAPFLGALDENHTRGRPPTDGTEQRRRRARRLRRGQQQRRCRSCPTWPSWPSDIDVERARRARERAEALPAPGRRRRGRGRAAEAEVRLMAAGGRGAHRHSLTPNWFSWRRWGSATRWRQKSGRRRGWKREERKVPAAPPALDPATLKMDVSYALRPVLSDVPERTGRQ